MRMDEDGYPTEDTIARIKSWDSRDFKGLASFIHSLWIYDEYIDYDNRILDISTGGWSGHEDIVYSIPKEWTNNFLVSSRAGGHYIFRE